MSRPILPVDYKLIVQDAIWAAQDWWIVWNEKNHDVWKNKAFTKTKALRETLAMVDEVVEEHME